jgi:hypothetical protein
MGERRLLQVLSALVALGLLIEIVSVLWFHPLAFVLFAFVGASLIGLGILVFLESLAFVAIPPAAGMKGDNRYRISGNGGNFQSCVGIRE